MATKSESTASGGIGFVGLLAVLFIALKLLDKIDWSWWWVLSPLWLPITVIFAGASIWVIASSIIGKK